MFYLGQKVVCVNNIGAEKHLAKGAVYTIYQIDAALGGFQLEEAGWKGVAPDGWEWFFVSSRFRPLIERKTDISAFKALLNPANHKELVD
jgi:hypothetical protein